MNYTIRDSSTVSTKKMIKRFSEREIASNDFIKGSFVIKNWRKYTFRDEVDIEFSGEIYAKISMESTWLNSKILTNKKYSISKIKVNRFIRKKIFLDVKIYLAYFGINLKSYHDIIKIKWV